MKHKHDQAGYHIVFGLLVLVVVAAVGMVGWRVIKHSTNSEVLSHGSQSENVSLSACNSAPEIRLPVKTQLIASVLYPGQIRGNNYKPHGGFRLNTTNNVADIILPIDAKLIAGARYIEQGEIQYMFDFEADCKIRFRFDHLLTLSGTLQQEANKLPEPKPDDSRTTDLSGGQLPAGTILATEVGFAKNHNVSFDFGMYDYNQKNKISQDQSWLADPDHQLDSAQYAVCWFDYLSESDRLYVTSLPAADQVSGRQSDYCVI